MASSRKVKVIALSLGKGLAKAVGVLTAMVMARVLTKEDVATYRQVLLAYMVAAPILQLGLGQGIYYFLPTEKVRIRGRVLDLISILSVMGVIYACFIAFGGNHLLAKRFSNPDVANLLLWMIPYAVITLPASQFESVLVARERVKLAAAFGVARQLLIGVATVIPVIFWKSAEAPIIGNVVASVLMAVAAMVLMLRATPNDSFKPSATGVKELLKFSVPLGLAAMVGTISVQIDKMIVASMCTPEEFAVYVFGAMEIPFMAIITGSVSAVMLVSFRKKVHESRIDEALEVYRKVPEVTSMIIFPLMFFLLIVPELFIGVLFSQDYLDSAAIFTVYLLSLPARIILLGGMAAVGAAKLLLVITVSGLIINGVTSYGLVALHGYQGAAWGGVIVKYLWIMPVTFFVISRRLQTSVTKLMPWRKLGVTFALAGLSALIVFYAREFSGGLPAIVELMMLGMLYSVCYAVLFWFVDRQSVMELIAFRRQTSR